MKISYLSICFLIFFVFSSAFTQNTVEDKTLYQPTEEFKWPIAYQVDIKRTYTDPKTEIENILVPKYRYMVNGMKVRLESPIKSGMDITIFRVDQGKMYSFLDDTTVNPFVQNPTKSYVVSEYSIAEVSKPFEDSGSWIFQNKEELSSTTCNKFNFVPLQKAHKTNEPFFVWLDCVSGFPVRVQYSSGIAEDYSNYISGPVPDSLFEIPGGYVKWDYKPTK